MQFSSGLALAGLLVSMTAHGAIAEWPRTSGEITVDGVMDEPAWKDAVVVAIDTETRPGENTPAPVRTAAYLIEDGENLYVGFEAEDPDPAGIRAYLRDRDSAYDDDWVGVILDTYGDERRAFEFLANALGVQMDLTNDDVNQNEDDAWDAIWDSAGEIHEGGYTVEMRIPLSQLRFPDADGKQSWGIDLVRSYPREHRYRFANNPSDRNLNCYLCQLSRIDGLEDARPARDLEIVPTLTASQVETTDEPGPQPLDAADRDVEAGVSARWGISPDLTLNLTINPDFSQVEADAAQLEVNNQFALFFPEKRPFFLEGADYFQTPIERAVFTRSVADPIAGAKLTGKKGNNTFGVFAAQDEVTNLIFPGAFGSDSTSLELENTALVGRYSRSMGEGLSLGGLITARSGEGYHNFVGGVDANWKLRDNHRIQAQYLRSDTDYPDDVSIEFEQPPGAFTGEAAFLGYDYDSRNWFAYARHQHRTRGFRADSGFIPQVDINQQVVGLGRIWHGDADNWYSQLKLKGDWDINHDDDGQLLEREVEAYFSFQGPMQSFVEVGGLTRDRLFDGIMFKEERISAFGEFQPRGGLEIGVWTSVGTQVDFANSRLGDQVQLEPFVEWNVTRHLLLDYEGSFVTLDTQQGDNIFDARVHDLRATWQFSLRSFVRITAQFFDVKRNPDVYVDPVDSRTKDVGRQLLYSYKVNPQTVFFLGYSDQLLENDDLSQLTTTDRTWFMKIGYAWTP
jgi:hypothetical protein